MAIYALKNTSSLDIISLIEYDGSGSISIPSGGFALYSDETIAGTDLIFNTFTASEYSLIDDLDGVLMATFKSLDGGEVEGTLDLTGSLVVTGSVNIKGSLTLNGKDITDVGDITEKLIRYSLRYSTNTDTSEYFYDTTILNFPTLYGGTDLPAGDTLFRIGSGNWSQISDTATLPITLNFFDTNGNQQDPNFSSSTIVNPAYHDVMFNIIKYGINNIRIKIESKADPNSYKIFRVDDINAYVKQESDPDGFYIVESGWNNDIGSSFTKNYPLYNYNNLIYQDGLKDYTDFGKFNTVVNNFQSAYIELSITTLEVSGNEPSNLQECWIYFDLEELQIDGVKNEIFVFESSTTWTPPKWLSKLTVHCIGGGGGGGGGAAGVKHKAQHFSMTNFNKWINYDLTQQIGHEIVFGGGGGAGGNVASKAFNASELSGVYNIIVGEGGRGGNGISYEFHTSNRTDLDFYPYGKYPLEVNRFRDQLFDLKRENAYNIAEGISEIVDPTAYSRFFTNSRQKLEFILTYPTDPTTESEFLTKGFVQNSRRKYDGQDGGFSSFSGRNRSNQLINVIAAGGIGGQTGTALKAYYSPKHYVCLISRKRDHDTEHVIPEGYILGGGSRSDKTRGDRILIGGPGGYGISMAYWEQIYVGGPISDFDGFDINMKKLVYTHIPDGLGTADAESNTNGIPMYKNTAPSLPWGFTNVASGGNPWWWNPPIDPIQLRPNNPRLPDLKLPYGSVGASQQVYGIIGYYNESPTKPSYAGPTGGGGGTGKQFAAVSDFVVNIQQPLQDQPQDPAESWTGPNDWSQNHIALLDRFTKKGMGGNNLNQQYLDNFPGSTVGFSTELRMVPFGLGGNGGYTSEINSHLNTLPQNGAKYGGGGGGGAGIYGEPGGPMVHGQDGGNGGKGCVVLVLEGLADFNILDFIIET